MNTFMGGIKYSLEYGVATIIKQDESLSGDIVIPKAVTYGGVSCPVTSVDKYAFGKTQITSIALPDSIKILGDECFYGCTNLTSIELPDGIKSLGRYCFRGCHSLTSINLPNSITALGDYCFAFCSSLTSINLPASITTLGKSCFYNCFNLYMVICGWTDLYKVATSNGVFSGIYPDAMLYVPKGMKVLYETTTPWSGFKYILDDEATDDATSIIVTIDGIVYSLLGNGGVTVCVQDANISGDIIIPETITYNDTTYTIRNVAVGAFAGTKITSISLSDSIAALGERCFSDCASLTSINLPGGITSLGSSCFEKCTSLTSINLPNSIVSLGSSCFQVCTSLTSINLPNSIVSLGGWCFSDCASLTSINLPSGIVSLDGSCFSDCASLTSINLPICITSLGNGCFSGCTSLAAINLPSGITALKYCCFYKCSSLTTINLPNGITALGERCFQHCSSLISITMSNTVARLGMRCFANCKNLTSIVLPKSITSLSKDCFYRCSSLSTVICGWNNFNPLRIGPDVFKRINSECELYVPKGSKALYEQTTPWSDFKRIIELEDKTADEKESRPNVAVSSEGVVLSISGLADGERVHIYDLAGRLLSSATASEGRVSFDTACAADIVVVRVRSGKA